ncbi:single-stranded DNA-binding protein, partial [Frankia sp. EI5c]|uniref:single-stranded DNA-binding protein n=1 Tax=Frankia sp. EI5c TaxID=683316 RepID=UPI001F5BD0F1
RRFDRAEQRWIDGNTLYLKVSCWRQLAENVAASLSRGDRALVVGRLRQNNFETQEGDRRVSYEIDAEAVAAELTWRPVEVRRVARAAPPDLPMHTDPFADPSAAPVDQPSRDGAGFGGADEGGNLLGVGPAADEERQEGAVPTVPVDRAVAVDAVSSAGHRGTTRGAAGVAGFIGTESEPPDLSGAGHPDGPGVVPDVIPDEVPLEEGAPDSALSNDPIQSAPRSQRGRPVFSSRFRAGASRLPGRLPSASGLARAPGEMTIGLADIVGEIRLLGMGGAYG